MLSIASIFLKKIEGTGGGRGGVLGTRYRSAGILGVTWMCPCVVVGQLGGGSGSPAGSPRSLPPSL